ncbi:non-specific lipid-transfer protein 1-like [Hibiscus syriacus]|uniref:non-specific lipid-transfer protein 1-like n=1 Tax=Hibiscus syriacus TaxID=106335 RepID=UPI0019216A11|nr:non-specific lipid-transfer protein 1-like [Hibiscus syriacus]
MALNDLEGLTDSGSKKTPNHSDIRHYANTLSFLKGPGDGVVPPACCSGIKTLNGEAQTTPERQEACNCLKSAAATITGINLNLASGLPGKCGVSIPYQISPSTDRKSVK